MSDRIPQVTFINCINLNYALDALNELKADDSYMSQACIRYVILESNHRKYKLKVTMNNNFIVEQIEYVKGR